MTSIPLDSTQRCPIDHAALSQQKTNRVIEPTDRPLERDADGVWHVRSYALARTVLRSSETTQAGFKAELIAKIPSQRMNPPILYQDGKPHHEQRRQTARFFTPKAVSEQYRQLMDGLTDRIIDVLRKQRQADLSTLSLKLAVRVAGQVVGLTNSVIPGMDRRLNAFFSGEIGEPSLNPRELVNFLEGQYRVLAFMFLDVKPAINARRKQPREDVISHLIQQGANDAEILTECMTYGAAGMVTTREFISIATWHLLEQPELRARYLAAEEAERHLLLEEILRLEPVVGHLFRRATADIELPAAEGGATIPKGALIDLHIAAINADEAVVGEAPRLICPARDLKVERAGAAVMSFGDGHHRCPGAFIAIQETDTLLQKLLRLPTLRIEQKPSVQWNELVTGYEIRDFIIAV